MAISKQAVTEEVAALNSGVVAELELRIDQWLVERGDHCGGFSVRDISSSVRAEIERRYRAAGWTVTYVSDQRDGDFWTFE